MSLVACHRGTLLVDSGGSPRCRVDSPVEVHFRLELLCGRHVHCMVPLHMLQLLDFSALECKLQQCLAALTGLAPEAHVLRALLPVQPSCLVPVARLRPLLESVVQLSGKGEATVVRAVAALRLLGGKGGFKKQLVRKGRAYARAVRERERNERQQQRAIDHNRRRRSEADGEGAEMEAVSKTRFSKGRKSVATTIPTSSHAEHNAHEIRVTMEKRRQIAAERERIRSAMAASVSAGFAVLLSRQEKGNSISAPVVSK